MARDRDRAAKVLRLRTEARRARHLAAQVSDPDDLEFYAKLADDWDREADQLENPAADDRRAKAPARRSR